MLCYMIQIQSFQRKLKFHVFIYRSNSARSQTKEAGSEDASLGQAQVFELDGHFHRVRLGRHFDDPFRRNG